MIMIDKCDGIRCPLKDMCLRYTSPKVSPVQSIVRAPFFYTNNGFECEMFWGEPTEIIIYNLELYFKKNIDNYLKTDYNES